MEESKIEWTDHTFNPWWGCTRVSEGCRHCYAETFAARWGVKWGASASRRISSETVWAGPEKWAKKAKKAGVRPRVFCASMADVFEDHRDLPESRAKLWKLIRKTRTLDWLLLTKRPENVVSMMPDGFVARPWRHVWIGCTVEDQKAADTRLPIMRGIPAALRFLSVEPLIGPVDLDLEGIHWVIVGGESGRGARPIDENWVRRIQAQCREAAVPFFFKQWGGAKKKETGRVLDGRTWDAFPEPPATAGIRKVVAARSAKHAGRWERMPVDRELAAEIGRAATGEGISRREWLDRVVRSALDQRAN